MFEFVCGKRRVVAVRHRDAFDNVVYCAQSSAGELARRCTSVDEWLRQARQPRSGSAPFQLPIVIVPGLPAPGAPSPPFPQLWRWCPPEERFRLNVEWQSWLFSRMRVEFNNAGVFIRPPGVV